MTKYLVLVKCPDCDTYHPYDNLLVDYDTARLRTFYLNDLMSEKGYNYIATEIRTDELIDLD